MTTQPTIQSQQIQAIRDRLKADLELSNLVRAVNNPLPTWTTK